jgi:hypothetical protein
MLKSKEIFGEYLEFRDSDSETVKFHLLSLELFPESILSDLFEHGLVIVLQNSPIENFPVDVSFIDDHPRGWPEGSTWRGIAGCYQPDSKMVLAGDGLYGCPNLLAHELGHAIGDLLGINWRRDLKFWHSRLLPYLPAYECQIGSAGTQEFLAETISWRITDKLFGIKDTRPKDLNEWIDSILVSAGRMEEINYVNSNISY